jgi:ABC-type amino acid transport substrate-binding protein
MGQFCTSVRLNLIFMLVLLLTAAQCEATPTPTATLPPPTPLLIPPIPRGDGTDLLDSLLDSGVIRVGIRVWPEASYSPPAFRGFSNARTGGALNGFEVDLAHLLADNLSLELEMVEAYPPVLPTGNWQGQWDIAVAMLAALDPGSPASTGKLVFSKPYGYMPFGVLIPATTTNIQSFANLSGQRVGVLAHSTELHLLTTNEVTLTFQGQPLIPPSPTNVQWTPLDNLPKAIRQLGEGTSPQLQAIFGPTPILEEAIKSDIAVKLAPQAAQVTTLPLAIAVVPRDNLKVDRLIQEIDKALDRLRRQGALAEVYQRWYGQDLSRKR